VKRKDTGHKTLGVWRGKDWCKSLNATFLLLGVTITFIVNIIAGYWRAYAASNKRKFEWVMAVHAPVPLVAILRRFRGVGFSSSSIIYLFVFVLAYFSGQRIGGLIRKKIARNISAPGRFLFSDILRMRSTIG